MRFEGSDAALFVTKDHQLLAEQLHLLWQIVELVRGAHRLPIATQEFTHRASWLDAGQLVVRWRRLPSVSRFHHCLPCTSLVARRPWCVGDKRRLPGGEPPPEGAA